ncbi:hypothetical protein [Cellulomonas sp. Leaf334]|uniref:hypothetical protein n=1 Tax=Cellulomonas sp. Leaf334 TaxID=1736339 RepID=UPI0006F5F8BF|nr:hypothetical protein [Cellulomonas sp. Leaf334]KQR16017.1 hypothetical protein ASF78_00810 [Cellulomonas sp. Leaf334]
MTRLSSVVGGLMRDLAQSHTISDAFTVDLLDAYRREPTLSQLPLPRVSIRSAQLTMRFAVLTVQEPVAVLEPAELGEFWLRSIRERVVPRVLQDVGRFDNERVVGAFERRLAVTDPTSVIDPGALLAEGGEPELVRSTIGYLTKLVDSLPVSTRRALEGLDLAGSLERTVRAEVGELRAAARRLEDARKASQADLDVSVTAEALAGVPDSQISELVLTVSMEEIQLGGNVSNPTRAVD